MRAAIDHLVKRLVAVDGALVLIGPIGPPHHAVWVISIPKISYLVGISMTAEEVAADDALETAEIRTRIALAMLHNKNARAVVNA